MLVVRTRGSVLDSRPSRLLLGATLLVIAGTLALPFTPIAPVLGFGAVPTSFVGAMALIVLLYIVAAEAAKRYFYRLPVFRA